MLKSLKIRLYPNKIQIEQINKLLGCCRFVYNKCLEKKIKSYEEYKISENLSSLSKFFHHDLVKQENLTWLQEQNTKVLTQTIRDVLSAYKNFYEGNCKYPKYKTKRAYKQTCRFPLQAISKKNDYSSYKLSLANIHNIRFKCSVKYVNYLVKNKDNIISATLSKTNSDKYYLSILIDGDFYKKLKITENCVGVDLGLKDFAVTSNGEIFENLHFKKSQVNRFKRLQREISKKQKGSNNRNKARIRFAKLNEKIRNRKLNYLYKISNSLLNENQVIVLEDLDVNQMLKNHKLAESITDVNFGEFRKILTYKSNWYGRDLIFIDKFYPSSKRCNYCGNINQKLKLSDRQWLCPNCEKSIERDYNAALNILEEGLRIIGSRTPEYMLVENNSN